VLGASVAFLDSSFG